MEREEYRFGADRILSVWIIHGSVFVIYLVVGSSIFSYPVDFGNIGLNLIFFTLIFVPHTFLYYNHLRHERDTVISLTGDEITIVKKYSSKTMKLNEILEVREYEATRTPWMIIVKWTIVTKYDEESFSSITFPRTKAWQLFGLKINKKSGLMPTFS